jgi:Phage integrase, N-terminal SAM-like domain
MSPLRRRMIEDMQIRNLTPNTRRVYVAQVVHFACHFRKSPELLGPAEIRTYLLHLTPPGAADSKTLAMSLQEGTTIADSGRSHQVERASPDCRWWIGGPEMVTRCP